MTTTLPYAHTWIPLRTAAAMLNVPDREMKSIVSGAALDVMRHMWTGEILVRLADIELIKSSEKEAR